MPKANTSFIREERYILSDLHINLNYLLQSVMGAAVSYPIYGLFEVPSLVVLLLQNFLYVTAFLVSGAYGSSHRRHL